MTEPLESDRATGARIARAWPWWPAVGALVLVALAAVTVFTNLGAAPPGRMSEQRCHRVAAHMVATGDWIVPVDHGAPRLQKPPLDYWLAGACIKATSEATYAVTRSPSAFAALLLLALTLAWGRALGGPLAGFLAGALLLAMDQYQDNGRRGDAEMVFALTSVVAVLLFQRAARSGRRIDLVAFGFALAGAFLAKATAAFVVVLVPVFALASVDEQARRRVDRAFFGVVAGAIALGFAWYGVVAARVPDALSAFFGDAMRPLGVDEPGGDAAHYRPAYYFLKTLPSITAPVIALLPLLLVQAWRARGFASDRALRGALACFVAPFVVFSLLPQKQAHYLLPALPALAVVLGVVIARMLRDEPRGRSRIGSRVALALAATSIAVFAGAEIAWSRFFTIDAPMLATALGALAVALCVVALLCACRGRVTPAACLAAVALALISSVRAAEVMPWRANLTEAVEKNTETPERAHAARAAANCPLLAAVFDVSDALSPDEP